MGPILNGLIKLQSVENRFRAAKAKLVRCRRNVVIQENKIGNLLNIVETKKEDIKLIKIQSDRLELELKSADDSIIKLRAALNTAKTNKEYASVLTQLNTTKADNSKVETQILELMKNIEADEAECRQMQEQIDQEKQKLEQIRTESEALALKYEAEISQIQGEWNHAAKEIPAESLGIFNRVAETYDGEALAIADQQEQSSGTYSCGGCYMGITDESVNLLMTKDDIIRCPNCTRILVLKEFQE